MTSPEPMTRADLLELAGMDVFGLLEDYEAALYTRSFHHAAASLQREIIELQADIAENTPLLSEEDPPEHLREQVLNAVTTAMDRANAPIAQIGRSRQGTRAADEESTPPRSSMLLRLLFGNAGQFWRAATFVLLGAVIVLAYFQAEARSHYKTISDFSLRRQVEHQIADSLGEEFDPRYLLHPRSVARVFQGQKPNYPGTARLYLIEPDDDKEGEVESVLVALGIPAERGKLYTVRARQADGSLTELGTFKSDGVIAATRLNQYASTLLATATLEIIDPSGSVVLST